MNSDSDDWGAKLSYQQKILQQLKLTYDNKWELTCNKLFISLGLPRFGDNTNT